MYYAAYTPQETTIACPAYADGAIDPTSSDDNGDLHVAYKIDANSLGNCNNGIPPINGYD